MYIADEWNSRIRKINLSTGIITSIAGNGPIGWLLGGYGGDGGPATAAQINFPTSVTADTAGNVYIGDQGNNRVRKINTLGIISTIAGKDTAGYTGDGGAATNAQLQSTEGICVDNAGNVYFSDAANNRVRKISVPGIITTIAGNGTAGYSGDGSAATACELSYPCGLFIYAANIYLTDHTNSVIRKIPLASTGIEQISPSLNSLLVFPNPANDRLTISLTDKESLVNIINLNGQTVYTHEYSGGTAADINLTELSNGIYFVKVNGQVVQRFVKQ